MLGRRGRKVIILFIICIFSLPLILSSDDDWPMFRYDPQHTGYSDCEMPDELELLWKYRTGDWIDSSPAVVNGKIYVGSWDSYVYCLGANNGEEIWKYETGFYVHSSPAVVNGKVYVGSGDYYLYCFDADTGRELWKYETGDTVLSSPVVTKDRVYVGSWDSYVYCLDADTGKELWKYKTGDNVTSSPTVANGRVYVGSKDGHLYCFGSKNIVDKTPPSIPTISDQRWSPQNGSIVSNNTPRLEWPSAIDTGSGVEKYTLQYSSNVDFIAQETKTIENLLTTSWTPLIPLKNGMYYWRVKASDKAGNESEYSDSLVVIINVPEQNTVTIIVISSTGYTIAGVSVKLGTFLMTSNLEGKAVFENIPNGTYSLIVTKEDYSSYSYVYDITGDTTIDVILTFEDDILEKDLEVLNIQYSPEDPKEGEVVSIMAQVRNNSPQDHDVETRLLVDYNTIEYQIIPIPSGDTKSVVFTWIAVERDHKVGIHALELPGEPDKSNNAQYIDITVVKLPIGEADALFQKANTYYYNGEFAKAKEYYILARDLYEQIPNEERISQCNTMIANCNKCLEAMALINQAEDAFEEGDCSKTIELYNQAISIYKDLKDTSRVEEAKNRLEEIEEVCASPPSQESNTALYLGIAAVAIVILGLAVYQITKKKPEKPKEEPIKKKPEEKEPKPPEKPPEEISPQMKKLLKEKEEWRKKLNKLKSEKEKLIYEGLMSEKMYQERYEELMDQLVDIEDKIIQEKMKGGKKK